MRDIAYDASSRCWILQMEASTYCIGLSEGNSSLEHIYWGPRIASAAASEMAHASGPLKRPFDTPEWTIREEYAPWGGMRFSEPGWPDEAGRNLERIWLDHVRNLYRIIDELRRRHPHVAFESCAGGGGRVDLGILSRVEQVWPSDNTDALDRLRIQEGFSYAYAPRVMMCWMTDCPNFLTKRTVPLRYRFHVAMAGSLGIGGDLSRWTQQEIEEASGFIATYKRVRSTIQNGLVYRLRAPRSGGVAATQYVARDGSEVVVFAWGHSQQFKETQVVLPLRGLAEEAYYADAIGGAAYSGTYLAQKGLAVNLVGDFDSCMVHLVRQAGNAGHRGMRPRS